MRACVYTEFIASVPLGWTRVYCESMCAKRQHAHSFNIIVEPRLKADETFSVLSLSPCKGTPYLLPPRGIGLGGTKIS